MRHKLKVIVNGMFYGDSYTKFMLWSVFLLGVATVGALIIAAALFEIYFVGAALVFAGIDAYLIHGLNLGVEVKGGEEQPEEIEEEEETEEEEFEVDEDLTIERLDAEEDIREKKVKKGKKVKDKEDKKKPDKTSDTKEKAEKTEAAAPEQSDYTERELKMLFKKYKVKKNHRPILIDHSDKYKIKECPAFAWTTRNNFCILLMESEPRKLTFGLETLGRITYAKAQPANQKKEYDCLVGQDLISLVFGEYRPVYQSVMVQGRKAEAKNLYILESDIYITAPSAREIMILGAPEFLVSDEVTGSDEYNQYYKQVYKQKILLDDGVLNIKDYQTRVRAILQKLAEATITPAAFRMTLQDMTMNQLITTEYSTYYTQVNRQIRERRGEQV